MTTATESQWVPLKEAWRLATAGAVDVSLNQFRNWVREQKHGIISGTFGCAVVIRKDTIPKVVVRSNS